MCDEINQSIKIGVKFKLISFICTIMHAHKRRAKMAPAVLLNLFSLRYFFLNDMYKWIRRRSVLHSYIRTVMKRHHAPETKEHIKFEMRRKNVSKQIDLLWVSLLYGLCLVLYFLSFFRLFLFYFFSFLNFKHMMQNTALISFRFTASTGALGLCALTVYFLAGTQMQRIG